MACKGKLVEAVAYMRTSSATNAGQGVDVTGLGLPRSMMSDAKPEPIVVKHWAPGRVKELLGRFGQ